jgi:hypothetical protein
MKKYVVLGVNENVKYLYYLPIISWGWKRLGWQPYVMYAPTHPIDVARIITPLESLVFGYQKCWQVEVYGYETSTIAQVARLYAACDIGDEHDIIMTSDVDMLPLSNYWNPSDLNITCYGRDLTDYHYPICYCAMTPMNWIKTMIITDSDYNVCIKHDLDERDKKTNSWLWDQDILTERLNRYGQKFITLIHRGTDKRTGYPIGRVDRSNWHLNHEKLIDAHLPHDILTNNESYKKVIDLLHHVWPTEDFKWFENYHQEFKKLL